MCLSIMLSIIVGVLVLWVFAVLLWDIILPILLIIVLAVCIKKLLIGVGKKKYSEENED